MSQKGGCKTNKQNKCKINVKMSVEKEKRSIKGKLVIPFLYIETIGVNGVDMPNLLIAWLAKQIFGLLE